jgi:capsular polysaccharide transport system permease protein
VSSLLQGMRVQARVVGALTLRETRTRFGGHALGYVWALAEPVLWIFTFYGLYVLLNRRVPQRLDVFAFLATGMIAYELVMKTQDRVSASISGNKALLFYPQVQPLDLVAARIALEMSTYVVILTILLGANALFRGELVIASMLTLSFGLVLAALLGGSLGLVLASAQLVFPTIERMKGPLMRPLFWISGLFFTAHVLPRGVRDIFLWNPIFHCLEIVRAGWFPGYHDEYASPGYVMAWILTLSFVGLTLERSVRHRIEVT